MRSLVAVLLAASILTICACGSSSNDEQEKPAEQPNPVAVQERAAELKKMRDEACGNPVRFPVTQRCIDLSGDDGPALKRENDLRIAVWRNCALTPASAEAIRRETIARGTAKSEMGRQIIREMERTEKDSDSPCVRADMRNPDCVAGDMNACARARANDKACLAWFRDPDTQKRIDCLNRIERNSVCAQAASAESARGSGGYLSDAQQLANDCARAQNSCLHTFDECADAKSALDKFLAQLKKKTEPAATTAQQQKPDSSAQSQPMDQPPQGAP